MKIALISPPWIAVPPVGYGGIERGGSIFAEGKVQKRQEATLFATGDSHTSAYLDFYYKKARGNNLPLKFNPYNMLNHLYHFFSRSKKKFDIIHNHSGRLALFFSHFTETPFLYTLHGSYMKNDSESMYDIADSGREVLKQFAHIPYVSISNKQREGLPELNYADTVYNGIILSEFDFDEKGGDNLLWFGRVTPTKGLDSAIEVAQHTGKKLHAIYFLDEGDADYFKKEIEPLCNIPSCTLSTEVKNIKDKSDFLRSGKALLFPIHWDEPFGIVMVEALACGTPVIAYAKGSVPEVIRDGETGFIVNDDEKRGDWIIKKSGMEGLREAVEKMYTMPEEKYRLMRRACRQHATRHFTVEKMVDEYEEVYSRVIQNGT